MSEMLTKKDLEEVLDKKLKPLEKDIKSLKVDTASVRKDQKTVISFFDKEYLELRKRVEVIEEKLGI